MKFLYATSFARTSGLANRFQVMAMVKAFSRQLGKGFFFGASDFEYPGGTVPVKNFKTSKSPLLAWRTLRFIAQSEIRVMYCREIHLLFWSVILNFIYFHEPITFAYEIHALPLTLKEKVLNWFVSRRANLLVFLTAHLRQIFLERYPQPKRHLVMVAHDGVDLDVFDISMGRDEARKKYHLPADKKIIGFFGRFKTMGMDKGISDILKAMKSLPDDVVFLAMGGKRRDREEYEMSARESGVSQRVIFVEQFEQPILAEYQKACDILLMPFPRTTHFAYYMSPLKMFEYMASKRPIIATDLPSIREVLSEKNACIVPPDDPKKLADGILRILNEEGYHDKIANEAYNDSKKYTWQKRVVRILEII